MLEKYRHGRVEDLGPSRLPAWPAPSAHRQAHCRCSFHQNVPYVTFCAPRSASSTASWASVVAGPSARCSRAHRAAIVRGTPRGLLGRSSGIESRLIHRPAVALVTIVLRLRIALTVAGIQVYVRGAAVCAVGG